MARSSHIYLIIDTSLLGKDAVVAAFTVKRECLYWLEDYEGHKRTLEVRRFKDSPIFRDAGELVELD